MQLPRDPVRDDDLSSNLEQLLGEMSDLKESFKILERKSSLVEEQTLFLEQDMEANDNATLRLEDSQTKLSGQVELVVRELEADQELHRKEVRFLFSHCTFCVLIRPSKCK